MPIFDVHVDSKSNVFRVTIGFTDVDDVLDFLNKVIIPPAKLLAEQQGVKLDIIAKAEKAAPGVQKARQPIKI